MMNWPVVSAKCVAYAHIKIALIRVVNHKLILGVARPIRVVPLARLWVVVFAVINARIWIHNSAIASTAGISADYSVGKGDVIYVRNLILT